MNSYNDLEHHLEYYLAPMLPRHSFADVYNYAVLPAGKLFRPKMALASFIDAGGDSANLPLRHNIWPFITALEIHHAYTLAHDDLPAMDDDDERRGRPSTHKAFGQWQAILAGDGLSVASFGLMAKINHPQAQFLIRVAAHALGPKGLIQGQALDLSGEMTQSFEKLILTHELKTARLIQLSLLGGALLAKNEFDTKLYKKQWRLGFAVGVIFQLLDDLCELTASELSLHEDQVNPWPTRTNECVKKSEALLSKIDQDCGKNVRNELKNYFAKTLSILEQGQHNLEKHINEIKLLLPVMTLLKRLSK